MFDCVPPLEVIVEGFYMPDALPLTKLTVSDY